MTVTLTSPALGLAVGATYTGPEEDWLLAEGYARRDGYTGPGVSNTGPTDVTPDKDPNLAENREPAPSWDADNHRPDPGRLDPAMNPGQPADPIRPAYDFDIGGVDTEAPGDFTVDPAEGPAAGGTEVTVEGQNFEGATGVTFDGVAGTDFELVDDSTIRVTTPAGTAGPADVAVTDNTGTKTETGAFTYTA